MRKSAYPHPDFAAQQPHPIFQPHDPLAGLVDVPLLLLQCSIKLWPGKHQLCVYFIQDLQEKKPYECNLCIQNTHI